MKYKVDNEGVKIKDAVQQKLQEEYEARQAEFSSYTDFIRAKAEESDFVRQFKEKLAGVKRAA